MKSTFPMRTGDVSYKIGLSPPAITGSWEVSMGFWGINENSWSISGASGKIYDNSGYMLGSYGANDYTRLEGVIAGSGHSIYQDGILLSNTAEQVPGDYNMVSISGNYLGGYLPSVEIGGKEVLDNSLNQTVPFWRRETDNRLLFVTENAAADLGFIHAVSGMGFYVKTGNLSGTFDTQYVKNQYGLIIFGSATTSGAYNKNLWNSLNMPMMSLNSHLVCPENLNWYGGRPSTLTVADETAGVYPERYKTTLGQYSIWAQLPVQGWEQLVYVPDISTATYHYFMPLGRTGVFTDPDTGSFALFAYNGVSETTIVLREAQGDSTGYFYQAMSGYAGDISPTNFDGVLQQDYDMRFADLYPSYTSGESSGIVTTISNRLGGTGVPDFTLTGTDWAHNQIYNMGRVVPQVATYDVNNLYRRTTLSSGLYPTDQFNMYTGSVYSSNSCGGDVLVTNLNSGNLITVWHHGMWTGQLTADQTVLYSLGGKFTVPELMVFSVTSTGREWAAGYDMWSTLTTTGKQLFINSVAGFFLY